MTSRNETSTGTPGPNGDDGDGHMSASRQFSRRQAMTLGATAATVAAGASVLGAGPATASTAQPAGGGRSGKTYVLDEKNLREQGFDEAWQFYRGALTGAQAVSFDDSGWQAVDLPHDYQIQDLPNPTSTDGSLTADPNLWNSYPDAPTRIGPFDSSSAGGGSIAWTIDGEGWYRKHFALSGFRPGQKVEIRFDGVYENSEVWINGKALGFHPYGYTSFAYDLSPYLQANGDNVLAVRVRNIGQTSRWYSGSGIYRHVWLTTTGAVRIPLWGTTVTTPAVTNSQATVSASVRVQNTSTRDVTVTVNLGARNGQGRSAASGTAGPKKIPAGATAAFATDLAVSNPALWSPEQPNLHTLQATVIADGKAVDFTSTTFGIRSISMDGTHGFLLNGKQVKMRGGNLHADHGPLGGAAYDHAEERRVRLLKEAGFTAIRTSHNPASPHFLDMCDQLGMLVYAEAFDVWSVAKKPDDYHLYFPDWWERDAESFINRDRNHPSIVIWSTGNEVGTKFTGGFDAAHAYAKPLADKFRALDPTRPITQGSAMGLDGFFTLPLNDPAYHYLDLADVHYQNEAGYKTIHSAHPDKACIQSESWPATMYENWQTVKDLPYMTGDFTWTAWDYLGEAAIGAPFIRKIGAPPFVGLSTRPYPWFGSYAGDIDLIGQRKPSGYYRQVVWDLSPLELGVERPAPEGQEQYGNMWSWFDELQSWTWDVPPGHKMKVHAYTSGDSAQVLVNGKVIATKTLTAADQRIATFTVPYSPGVLTVRAYLGSKLIGVKELVTVGPPAAVRLTADVHKLGSWQDPLAYILAEIVDKEGRLVPDAVAGISFGLYGPAKIAGTANGNPHNVDSFQSPHRESYHGQALLVVKSTGRYGPARITAQADGLRSGILNL